MSVRKSLWEDSPIIRNGQLRDMALEAMQLVGAAIDSIGDAIKSDEPDDWLSFAERDLQKALDNVRALRDAAQTIHPDSQQFGVGA